MVNSFQEQRARTTDAVARVQSIPYVWPADPTAEATRCAMRGTCAGKHALPAEELGELGIASQPLLVIGPLISGPLLEIPALAAARQLLEVHECLTVMTPWSGPLRVDVTWDPPLVRAGLSGTLEWSADCDMACALRHVGPVGRCDRLCSDLPKRLSGAESIPTRTDRCAIR